MVEVRRLLETASEPSSIVVTVNAGAIPADHWTQDPVIGGGRLIGEGCHFVDLVRYLADSPIVRAQITTMGDVPGLAVSNDKLTVTLSFADGSLGTVHYLANGPSSYPKERIEVFNGGRVLQIDNFRKLRAFGWSGARSVKVKGQDKGHAAFAAAFIEAVKTGGPSPSPFDELMEVSRCVVELDAIRDGSWEPTKTMNDTGRQWRAGRAERFRTLWRLGPSSVARVARYRIAKRLGLWERRMGGGSGWSEPVLRADVDTQSLLFPATYVEPLIEEAEEIVSGRLRMFSGPAVEVGTPPLWHNDPYEPSASLDPKAHWSRRSGQVADIKTVWESSRFVWAPTLARAWRVSGDQRYIETLQGWIQDWTQRNPTNLGPNWECGQETSLRMLHVLVAAHLTGSAREPEPGLVRFVREHVERVSATTSYAIGQDNNHGTSEAAALFVGGSWLAARGDSSAGEIAARGRTMLEERVVRLVASDGSFSQYSVNYHRVLLDTLSVTEWWRRELEGEVFSDRFTNVPRRLRCGSTN